MTNLCTLITIPCIDYYYYYPRVTEEGTLEQKKVEKWSLVTQPTSVHKLGLTYCTITKVQEVNHLGLRFIVCHVCFGEGNK